MSSDQFFYFMLGIALLISGLCMGFMSLGSSKKEKEKEKSEPELVPELINLHKSENLESYYRVHEVVNKYRRDYLTAVQECAKLQRERDEAVAERERLESKLGSAQDILKSWSHPGMTIRVSERVPGKTKTIC